MSGYLRVNFGQTLDPGSTRTRPGHDTNSTRTRHTLDPRVLATLAVICTVSGLPIRYHQCWSCIEPIDLNELFLVCTLVKPTSSVPYTWLFSEHVITVRHLTFPNSYGHMVLTCTIYILIWCISQPQPYVTE